VKRLLILVSLLALPATGITLVHQGRSNYTIVLAAQASPSEQRAAKELQRFIEEMSGARLPVITDDQPARGNLVLVGDSSALRKLKIQAPSGPESFVIQTAGKTLVIAGGRQRGTMYGVYTFLDKSTRAFTVRRSTAICRAASS
jgi:alpha-glucuronidase